MIGPWRGAMVAALAATLGRPGWWAMALAAFLVRGGIGLVLLPIVLLPTPAAVATALAPTISGFAFGGLTPERILLVVVAIGAVAVVVAVAGLTGAWLDHAQLREAADDDELDLAWEPVYASARDALALRLAAHLPTLAALLYASVRLVTEAYAELLSPADPATPVFLRVAARAPDAIAVLAVTWAWGETVGPLAARRVTMGSGFAAALATSARQVVTRRGLATLALTGVVLAAALLPFLLAAGRAWAHLRGALLDGADALQVGGALLVLTASWVLGLAVLGFALAWRTAAWTAEVAPAPRPFAETPVAAPSPAATTSRTG